MKQFETLRDAIIKAHKNINATENLATFKEPSWGFWMTLAQITRELGGKSKAIQAIHDCKICNPHGDVFIAM